VKILLKRIRDRLLSTVYQDAERITAQNEYIILELSKISNSVQSNIEHFDYNNYQKDVFTTQKLLSDYLEKNDSPPDYEPILEHIYSKFIKTGDVVIDIGAHSGRHLGPLLRLVGDKGKCVAFEPLKKQYE